MVNHRMLLLNQVITLLARITIVATMLHFLFTFSTAHAVIVILSYLIVEVMELQLKMMVEKGKQDLIQSLLPKDKPNLSVVQEETDDGNNETSH